MAFSTTPDFSSPNNNNNNEQDDNNNKKDKEGEEKKVRKQPLTNPSIRVRFASSSSIPKKTKKKKKKRKQYQRKRAKPQSEQEQEQLRQKRQAQYDQILSIQQQLIDKETTTSTVTQDDNQQQQQPTLQIESTSSIAAQDDITTTTVTTMTDMSSSSTSASSDPVQSVSTQQQQTSKPAKQHTFFWSFESLFPQPVWDDQSIQSDLFGQAARDQQVTKARQLKQQQQQQLQIEQNNNQTSLLAAQEQEQKQQSPLSNVWKKLFPPSDVTFNLSTPTFNPFNLSIDNNIQQDPIILSPESIRRREFGDATITTTMDASTVALLKQHYGSFGKTLSNMRPPETQRFQVKQRVDDLNRSAKRDILRARHEEAQESLEQAIRLDPQDGRAYLALSRVAEKRRDFKLARQCLKTGIANAVYSYTITTTTTTKRPSTTTTTKTFIDNGNNNNDNTVASENNDETRRRRRRSNENDDFENQESVTYYCPNPYLLQALGALEERAGYLSIAEDLYLAAIKSCPSHAAAWVSLAQLRTRKFRQSDTAGRYCYESAERELERAGRPPSSHVYTAWAAMEYKKVGNVVRARELFRKALSIDVKCSAAYLQLGTMEYKEGNYDVAEQIFDLVLKFDARNSRVLQAYAILETKRPDGNTRKAIDLFERALAVNPRDGGVLQAYALFVAELGDVESARKLLQRGTKVSKRHAPLWQAWGVLETRDGNPIRARQIFQEGIWTCAQISGCQSGGYNCARLWQGWGVLEAQEGDYAAARRCFARALDADNRNVAAITAWTRMEEQVGNVREARFIMERALTQIPAGSQEKKDLWRAYELMEQRLGETARATLVSERYMREIMTTPNEITMDNDDDTREQQTTMTSSKSSNRPSLQAGKIWYQNGVFESKVPKSIMPTKPS